MQIHAPLIERELLRAGRRGATYAARVFVPVLALLVVAPPYVYARLFGGQTDSGAVATNLSALALVGQVGIAYFLVAWIASRAIADEASDNTLDLITLADKSHVDFYAGKSISVWLQAAALLLSLVPLRILAVLVDENAADPIFAGFVRHAIAAALVCTIALFFSALVKGAGLAFVATLGCLFLWQTLLAALYDWAPAAVQAQWAHSDIASAAGTRIAALIAIAAAVGTVAVVRHPEFDVFRWARRRKHARMRVPASPAACVARIVQCEGGGVATFARTWWGRAMVAFLLALFAYGLDMPSASLMIGGLVGAEAFVVGSNLRRRHIVNDLALTTVGRRGFAHGMLQGQFARALVFLPAIVFSGDLYRLADGVFFAIQRVQESLGVEFETLGTVAGFALWLTVSIVYAALLIYFFTAAGIQYAVEGCSAGRMILNLLALLMILSLLMSMITIGYYVLAHDMTAPSAAPPSPTFGTGLGEILAAFVILPIVIMDYRRRLVRHFTRVPDE